jgi:hypothetical protein
MGSTIQFNDGETKLWVYKSNDTSDEQIKITDENGNNLTAYYVKNQVIKYNIMSSIADGIIISFKSKNYNDTLVMDKNFNYINMTQMRMANDAERKEIDETYREQNNTPSYSQEDIDDDVKEGNKTATKLVEDNKDTKTANESKDGKYHFSDVKEGLGRVHEFECNPSESKQGRSQIDSIATKLYSLGSNQDDLNKYLGSLNEHGFKGIKDSEIKITPTTTIDDIKVLLNDYKIPKSSLQIGTETDSVFRQGLAQVKDIINSIMDDKKCSFNEALRELFLNKTYSSKLREVYKRIECTDKNGDSFEYFKNEGGTASASLVSLMGIREDPENAFDNGAKHSPFEQILVDLYLNGAQGFYSDNLAIHGKIGDDDIAGEMDLLVVNSEGSFEVWDYKTVKDAKNKSFNFYKPYNQNDPLIQQYSFQLSSYAQMLEDKYSIDVTSIKIFAIAKEEITGHDIKFSKENNCTIEIPRISKERLDNRARANKANMKVAQTAEEKKEVVAENTENRHKQISKAEAYAMRFPYKLLSNTVIGTNEFFSTQNLFDILTTIDPSISDKINTSVAEGGDMYKIFAAHPELIEFLLEEAKNQIKKQINDINENISSLYEDGDKHKLDIDVDSLLDVNNDDNKQYINDHGILAFVFAANISVGELIDLKCKELNTTLNNLKKHIKPAQKSTEENTPNAEQNNNENSEFEDSFEDDNEDNDDGALLRKEIQGDYVIWDEKKEMEWLKSRLPNLSDKTMVVLRETLINVIKDGNSAWSAFVNGVVYVRSDAAAGTLYHEAFHALYHNILNKEEQLDIMRLARIKFGANLSTIGLEEAVANDFMEYKLKADEAIENRRKFSDKSVFGRFFNKILTIVYAIGDMLTENRSELDEYYRHIDMGFYSKRPIVFTSLSQMKQMERDANRKDGMSYFDTLDRHVQNALNAKGFTREQFDSLSDEEQDDEMMCCK